MPTARWNSAAVHIPGCGDLVLGGIGIADDLPNAELLDIIQIGDIIDRRWREIEPMIEAWNCISAVYFDEAVYVVGRNESAVQMLSLVHNQPGQWTIISSVNPPLGWCPSSMNVFNGRILVSTGTLPKIYNNDLFHLDRSFIHF